MGNFVKKKEILNILENNIIPDQTIKDQKDIKIEYKINYH